MKQGIMAAAFSLSIAAWSIADAQTAAQQAGGAIGSALFGQHDNRAYYEGQIAGAYARESMERARQAEVEASLAEKTDKIQGAIAEALVKWGIDQTEATSIASAYRITLEEPAIVARSRREGSKATELAIADAYNGYNYLLVDQLLIGLAMTVQDESKRSEALAPPHP